MGKVLWASLVGMSLLGLSRRAAAQAGEGTPEDGLKVARLVAEPAHLVIERGMTSPLKVTALDKDGKPVKALFRYAGSFRALRPGDGGIMGLVPGEHELVVTVVLPPSAVQTPVTVTVPVTVKWPAVAAVAVTPGSSARLYSGTTLAFAVKATHKDGSARAEPKTTWSSSNPAVASVDKYGFVTARAPGQATISGSVEGVTGESKATVAAFAATSLEATTNVSSVRTGDVVQLKATARARGGNVIGDLPITWTYTYTPDDSIAAPGAPAAIVDDRFVAEQAGIYNILATAGNLSSRTVVEVKPRQVVQEVQFEGRGSITDVHTSDLWPWQGSDGRDYMLVGTWGGDGYGYIYDITDPTQIKKTDSVKVDARTINDVTVSPTAKYGAFSREGASSRVNGVVILDLANPAHPKIASEFSEQLTGGVHNMFPTQINGKEYLFAISGGDKYVIIDMSDIYKPRYVGEYNHPNSRVHDVWVRDGIAYSSEWGTGVVVVDVGNGKWGGTPQQPKLITTYATKSGATHEVYPYFSAKTGKTYIFLGDEVMNRKGRAWQGMPNASITTKGGVPQVAAGYTHIIDFTDPEHPKNVARYENPEFGSHDIIVEDDILYQAYYDGGMRVVDVSGELLGNLQRQSREIAVFKPFDPNGFTANAAFTMNAMPYKGHIFFTDFNSGLWSVKLKPTSRPVP
ncbi:MAG: Ig-like domain-containing protein [Gemmatimonadota bacterium]